LYSPGYDDVRTYLADGQRVAALVLRIGLPTAILAVTFLATSLRARGKCGAINLIG
jgi:hypothetical protein